MRNLAFGSTLVVLACGPTAPAAGMDRDAQADGTRDGSTGGDSGVEGNMDAPEDKNGEHMVEAGADSTADVVEPPDQASGEAESTASAEANEPTIDRKTQLIELTAGQKGALCDWQNTALGGYGKVTDCPGLPAMYNAKNQATCVVLAFFEPCPNVTVGDWETCVLAMLPSMGCDFPSAQCSAVYKLCPGAE